MARLLALLAWPLAIAGGLAARLAGRDPLRLRRPPAGSLWIDRAQPSPSSYFNEACGVEGRGHGGFGRLAGRALIALAPARWRTRAARGSAKDPAQVPDEIYTLW